jgi:hypothetical protein
MADSTGAEQLLANKRQFAMTLSDGGEAFFDSLKTWRWQYLLARLGEVESLTANQVADEVARSALSKLGDRHFNDEKSQDKAALSLSEDDRKRFAALFLERNTWLTQKFESKSLGKSDDGIFRSRIESQPRDGLSADPIERLRETLVAHQKESREAIERAVAPFTKFNQRAFAAASRLDGLQRSFGAQLEDLLRPVPEPIVVPRPRPEVVGLNEAFQSKAEEDARRAHEAAEVAHQTADAVRATATTTELLVDRMNALVSLIAAQASIQEEQRTLVREQLGFAQSLADENRADSTRAGKQSRNAIYIAIGTMIINLLSTIASWIALRH